MPKISTLTAAGTLADADVMPVVQGGTTKKTTMSNLKSYISDAERWVTIGSSAYTATPASTSRITCSDTSSFFVGGPVRYTYGGTAYYGIVTAIGASSYIDIAGATLDVAQDLTLLEVGTAELVRQMEFFVSGTYGDDVSDLLAPDMNRYVRWDGATAYLVRFFLTHNTADTGASQPKVNFLVGGAKVGTSSGGNGPPLAGAGTWVANSAIYISTTNYQINYGDAIELRCGLAGANGDAADLSAVAVFVFA